MRDGCHTADGADKLFTCIAGSGNLSHALLLIHARACSCSCFGIFFLFYLKCTLAIVCLTLVSFFYINLKAKVSAKHN